MAALNTLRTKGGVLLSIIIGISLLAFLLGDGQSLFRSQTINVGEINGEKITHRAFSEAVEQQTTINLFITGKNSLSAEETQAVQEQAWHNFLVQYYLNGEFKQLGMEVSDEELLDMAGGRFTSPMLITFFGDPQTGMLDKTQLQNFISGIEYDQSGRARLFWNQLEKQMTEQRSVSKLAALIGSGMFVTDLEVNRYAALTGNTYDFEFASRSTASIPDSTINVSDAEMRAYYDKHPGLYKQTAARTIEYVTFEALPSKADYDAAAAYVATLTENFAASDDLAGFAELNSEEKYNPAFFSVEELPAFMQEDAANATPGKVFGTYFDNNKYTLAALVNKKVLPDSIEVMSMIVGPGTNTDSLVTVLKKGASFGQIAATHSLDKNPESAQPIVLAINQITAPEYMNRLLSAGAGSVLTFDINGNTQILKVNRTTKPVQKMQIAQVVYNVVPSAETEQEAYTKAGDFADAVAASKDFDKTLKENAYSKRVANISPEERNVRGIDDSREIVRWAYTAEEGQVSNVITIGSKNIIARLTEIREKGNAPFEQVKELIKPMCITEKKIKLLTDEMAGITSLDAVGTDIQTAANMDFASFYVPNLGMAPEVIGAMTSLGENNLSKPLPAGSAVAMIQVTAVNPKEVDPARIRLQLDATNQTALFERMYQVVQDQCEIKDERVLYF